MKHKIKSLIGFTIGAKDGEIGKVTDFYFDDKTWTVRYLVVETGSWLFGRKVLLSPQSIRTPDWQRQIFHVNLTMDQIKNSPEIDTEKPVSRQHEEDLYSYYPWGGYYWEGGMGSGGMGMSYPISLHHVAPPDDAIPVNEDPNADTHLRSVIAVTDYSFRASDGEIGDVDDFMVNVNIWVIEYIEIDTGNWFPGKKVLISPYWISEINWRSSTVTVKMTEEQVKNSPEYEPDQQVSDSYQANLQNYYGRFFTHK